MFDIGFTELTLLAVIGLLVLGPERLPVVTRMVTGYLRKARRTWASVRAEIEAEMSAEEIREAVGKPLDELRKATMERIDVGNSAADDAAAAGKAAPPTDASPGESASAARRDADGEGP